MKLQKGMIVSPGSIEWYIVSEITFDVKTKKTNLYCICDCANNIYSWEADSVQHYLSTQEIARFGWDSWPKREFPKHLKERGIPHDVISETLLGKHSDRFDHWGAND